MPRGGWRGGGRPAGSKTKRKMAIAAQAAAEGITPVEVMLRGMRSYAERENPDWDKALVFATAAAPYIHPRLNAIQHSGKVDSDVKISDGESAREFVESRIAGIAARAGPGGDPSRTIQ